MDPHSRLFLERASQEHNQRAAETDDDFQL
jgi:hypothetical protein